MPRVSNIARKARRTLAIVEGQFRLIDEPADIYHNPSLICPYCPFTFATPLDRSRHVMAKKECRTQHMYALPGLRRKAREAEYQVAGPSTQPYDRQRKRQRTYLDGTEPGLSYNDPRERPNRPSSFAKDKQSQFGRSGRTCGATYVEDFPISTAGQPISPHCTHPTDLRAHLRSQGSLSKRRNFEAAELLLTTGLNSSARTRHLQSAFYKDVPWPNDRAMMQEVDRLPRGPSWHAEELLAGEGSYKRTHILYRRSVIDVIRDLIGNPQFRLSMRYSPERHWTSAARTSRVYGETWTGDWWWRQQLFLRDRCGTIVPVIIASDATTLTKLSGNQSAHPIYLTIGNISKTVRRKASTHATSIIGYLPVDKFKDVPDKSLRSQLKGQLLHLSMRLVTEPLIEAGQSGVEMWCADGRLRRVYPRIAAFVGDFPEQSTMACTSQGGCPICLKQGDGRGDERRAAVRTRRSTLAALEGYRQTRKKRAIDMLGLKPWWPWWADLPSVNFGSCIAPDLLHQLHKGMFKSHAMRWVQSQMGKPDVDRRFMAMPRASGLRHFKRGVSTVQQWTGRETKEMVKVFLPLIAEHSSMRNELVTLIRALLDFSYLSQSARLTEGDVEDLRALYEEMQRLKPVLVSSGVYEGLKRLDAIPKWHMISHYADWIPEMGTPDGYSTESPEYLHIIYVKRGWNASNKRDPIPQIIKYCERLEALRIHRTYLDTYYRAPRRVGRPVTTAYLIDDEVPQEIDRADVDDVWEEDWIDGDDDGMSESHGADQPEANLPECLQPERRLAVKPTERVAFAKLKTEYGAQNLDKALFKFLRPFSHGQFLFLPHDELEVWHKLSLYHPPLSFAPDEPLHHDNIRARPATGEGHRVFHPAAFDTVLFEQDKQELGLHRYRAGRVRAIFRLPQRLRYMYNGHLAYLELFTPFNPNATRVHALHTTSHARHEGVRECIIVPIDQIVLACHLAPRFQYIDPDTPLDPHIDLLEHGTRFFFNHYYNRFTFQLIRFWRELHWID